MSEHAHSTQHVIQPEALRDEKLPLLQMVLGLSLAVGVIICLLGAIFWPEKFAFSYLLAATFWFTIIAGCFFWNLVHYATDAAWSTVIRRQLENVSCTMPLLAILSIPLIFYGPTLWDWLLIEDPAADALMSKKTWFLAPDKVIIYSLVAFAYFTLWSWRMRHISVKQDYDGDPKWTKRSYIWAYSGIVLFVLLFTAIALAWLMALDYKWFSTMWGVYIFAGSAWSGMATIILISAALQYTGHLKGIVTDQHYHIMGKLLLAFTIFWSYIAFSQYMLIWYANIPEETSWYLVRNSGWWWLASTLLFVGHFIVPFLFLLPRDVPLVPFIDKRNPLFLITMGIYCLIIQALDLYIVIMPVRGKGFGPDLQYILLDFAALFVIGGLLTLFFLHMMSRRPLFPSRDPRLQESIHISN